MTRTPNLSDHPTGAPTRATDCEVCGRTGPAADRCRFGADDGPCDCWNGAPCAQWVAGWNMPGYLPESEPATFATLADAVAYLTDAAERFADEDGAEPAEIVREINGAAGWYTPRYGAVLHLWAVPAEDAR